MGKDFFPNLFNRNFMTTHSSGDFCLYTGPPILLGDVKAMVKFNSNVLSSNLTEAEILAIGWSRVLCFFDLVQPHLYVFRLGEGENLAEINANISGMNQCSYCYGNGIAEKTYYHYG